MRVHFREKEIVMFPELFKLQSWGVRMRTPWGALMSQPLRNRKELRDVSKALRPASPWPSSAVMKCCHCASVHRMLNKTCQEAKIAPPFLKRSRKLHQVAASSFLYCLYIADGSSKNGNEIQSPLVIGLSGVWTRAVPRGFCRTPT